MISRIRLISEIQFGDEGGDSSSGFCRSMSNQVADAFSEVIDWVRLDERTKAAEQHDSVQKKTTWYVLTNRVKLRKRHAAKR